jgi:hypothetical protein
VAVDFYVANPKVIAFLVRSSFSNLDSIRALVRETFDTYFVRLYEDCDYTNLSCDGKRVLSLLAWLLVKTRNDFVETGSRETYLEEWDFFLSALSQGIYGS